MAYFWRKSSLVALLVSVVGAVSCAERGPAASCPSNPEASSSALPAVGAAQLGTGSDPEGAKAFERLRAIVGDWEATTAKGATVRASYRLVSADSVLVETFTTPSGKQTLTVFHLDGSSMIATHYCAQGNQPRLYLRASESPARFELVFFDATNLQDPRKSHLRRLLLDIKDATHFDKTEEYVEDGRPDVTVFAFSRVPEK